ncbi:uncharacterized protein BDCG_02435 [Blastomyces dermatitidis ER-3]|uniref:Uncharacterized protein n=1 Tax=Ajellomyces dermatitidis (strain ER-3 / ATCC MYA-2586) TaxID=559297 RepID=A0ABP2ETW3_AJEDR|nr:uncharacterized protein BDCG_02435 [Blastomyces dermatitidis ER-3]EEQ87315.2 hypothetical protein BDCG_02435 [Blastomyces dermatitidis ER-3]
MASETIAGTGMGLWGNVKIPDISSLKPGENDSDWRMVDWNSAVQFTSLQVFLSEGPWLKERDVHRTSHHFDVQCLNNILAEKEDLATLSYNMVSASSGPGHSMLTYLVDEFPAMTDGVGGDISSCAKFMFGFGSRTQHGCNHTWELANCTLGNLSVDSRVECQSESCRVQAMRPSQRVENYKSLTHYINFTFYFLPTATDRDTSTNYLYSATLTERWVNDTSLLRGGRIDMDLWKLDPKVLSARMEVGLNSSWPASFATIYRGTPLPKDPATYEAMGDCSTEALPLYCFVPVEACGFRYVGEVYKCDRSWLALFLIIFPRATDPSAGQRRAKAHHARARYPRLCLVIHAG